MDSLPSSWFCRRPRWIKLVGIPYHLFSEETVKSLIGRFGIVKQFRRYGPTIGEHSRTRVLVDNCDVKLIPHFLPLVDLGGVVYRIRLLLDLSEGYVDDSECPSSQE